MAARGRSAADETLAAGLAAGKSVATAAATAGVSERTAYRRLADESFRRRVSELRAEMVDRAVGFLSLAASRAVGTLVSLLDDRGTPAAVRRSAASAILGELVRLKGHLELEERVAELERKQGG